MTTSASRRPARRMTAAEANNHFLIGVARAFGGAIIFALPMLMTMEMWFLGFYVERTRLAILLIVAVPLLVGLSHFLGFERTFRWKDDLLDAFVAYFVAFVASALILWLLSIIQAGMSLNEIVGKIAIQTFPASIGALLAQSELGMRHPDDEPESGHAGYWGELFIMLAGALFLSLNLAPTEEIILLAYRMTQGHAVMIALLSMVMMHVFVYRLKFRGQSDVPPNTPGWSLFIRFTVVGYVLALAVSWFSLWVFGRLEGTAPLEIVQMTVVLAFPAALGAAAARLIL